MSKVNLKIDSELFNASLKDEMAQNINFYGEQTPYFKHALTVSLGQLIEYKDWKLSEGFYSSEFEISGAMFLDKLKVLSRSGNVLKGCRLEVFVSMREKFGYYQINDGFTEAGFSIKKEPQYFERLGVDFMDVGNKCETIKINVLDQAPGEMANLSEAAQEKKRKAYSFFINSPEYKSSSMEKAIVFFGNKD